MHLPHIRAIPVAAALLCLGKYSPAAISVSGISNETSHNGGRSLIVDDPAGFVTTASLNGSPIAVGESVSVDTAGFYELVVTETPGGGGAAIEETFLFNIREPGRGSTETGLPAFNAAPLVNDASSAVNTGQLITVTPAAYPDDLPVPFIALLQKTNGDPLWLNSKLRISDYPANSIQLRRGFGYTLLPPATENIASRTAALPSSDSITIEDNSIAYTSVTGDIVNDIDFGDGARLEFTGEVTVDAGVTLTIGAGGIIRLAPDTDIHVDGTFVVNATPENPTTFAPNVPGEPWGGFFLQETTSMVEISGTIFHGSGADQDWFDNNSGFSTHRDEQALFLVGADGAQQHSMTASSSRTTVSCFISTMMAPSTSRAAYSRVPAPPANSMGARSPLTAPPSCCSQTTIPASLTATTTQST